MGRVVKTLRRSNSLSRSVFGTAGSFGSAIDCAGRDATLSGRDSLCRGRRVVSVGRCLIPCSRTPCSSLLLFPADAPGFPVRIPMPD